MGKNNIHLPDHFIFTTSFPIRITDINYGGHVGNDSVLSIVHEARMRFLDSLGYSEMNLSGVGLIMNDLAADFKSEMLYGDVAEISIGIAEISKASFEIVYQISVERKGKKIHAANVRTGMVCFDYASRKIRPIPEEARQKLSA